MAAREVRAQNDYPLRQFTFGGAAPAARPHTSAIDGHGAVKDAKLYPGGARACLNSVRNYGARLPQAACGAASCSTGGELFWELASIAPVKQGEKRDDNGATDTGNFRFWEHQRPKYLFSGPTKCGCCGGGFSMVSATLLGCSTSRNKGVCDNRTNIRRDRLEARVLAALRDKLLDPALFKISATSLRGS